MSSTIERFLGFDPGEPAEEHDEPGSGDRLAAARSVSAAIGWIPSWIRKFAFIWRRQIEDNLAAGMDPVEARPRGAPKLRRNRAE